jgi:hypothetical protein
MTEKQILTWIKTNLSPHIDKAIEAARIKNPMLIYTQDWIAAMTMRETGQKIAKLLGRGVKVPELHTEMKGDYGQREGETEKQYHGFHYMQIDIGSYPSFIASGDWKDPLKGYKKAIEVLEGKRIYLFAAGGKFKPNEFPPDMLYRAITAAYNCGEGNVAKVLREGKDVDARTYNHDYSKEVWRFRELYKSIV